MCESIFVMLSLIFPTITIVCETSIFVVGTIVCVRHFEINVFLLCVNTDEYFCCF
jgi:hypothetical protein